MRAPTCATPTASDFTPAGSTIDTPLSTHGVSEDLYRGDTILPSIEVSDQQPPIDKVTGSSVPQPNTTAFTRITPPLSKDYLSGSPSRSPSLGLNSIKSYEGSFTFRLLYNATPEPGSEVSDNPSEPLTDTDKEVISGQPAQSDASVKGLSNNFRRLDLDTTSESGEALSYDVKDEIPPPEPYFDPAFQKALKKGLQLAGKIAACLQRCDLSHQVDSDLHKLYRTSRELESFESPATRTIGIVGDSATGKSSLINSLLDFPNLAHKGDQGSAVTSFVTEYRHRSKHHKAAFTMEVEYFNETEINEQLHELLWSYRQFFTIDKETDVNARDYEQMERESALALATLKGVLGDRTETEPAFLQAEDAFDSILNRLKGLARAIQWPEGAQNGKWSSTADTAEQCHEQTGVFMKEGLWPLTKIVRIYLPAQVLKTGVILADLPGYRDVNFARVKAAQRYLFNCDEVFVVANINRVVSDQSVHSVVSEYLGKGNSKNKGNLAIICTHAEIIDVPEAEKTYCGAQKRIVPEKVKAARQQMKLTRKLGVDEYEKAVARYKYLFIEARNAAIREQLVKAYSEFYPAGDLDVFCVANQDYQGYVEQGEEAHELAIHGSGIPRLRRFCHSIPARAQFRATNHFLEVQLKGLVQSLELWLSAGARNNSLQLPSDNFSEELLADIRDSIEHSTSELSAVLEEHVSQQMKTHKAAFDRGALDASNDWRSWHYASYQAFCRRNGTYSTPAVGGLRRWNEELLSAMNEIMEGEWELLESDCDDVVSTSDQDIEKQVQRLTKDIQKLEGSALFVKIMRTKEADVKYILTEEAESMMKQVRQAPSAYHCPKDNKHANGHSSIIRDATEDHHNSYILEQMLSTYRSCAQESGTGMKNRMFGIMAAKMRSGTIFTNIRRRIQKEMNALFEQRASSLSQQLEQVCEQIGADLAVLRGSEATLMEEDPEVLDAMEQMVAEAKKTLDKLQDTAAPARAEARKRSYI